MARWLCAAILLLGVQASVVGQTQDLWVLPQTGGWIGYGQIGSPTDPGLVVVVYQNQIMLVPPTAVAGYLQLGGRVGWPNVVVALYVDGKPVAAPISQVPELLRKGAQVSEDLVIMHKGNDQIAVPKAQVDQFTAQGYQLGPKDGWIAGTVMCFKSQLVVVDVKALEKYKKEGADLGPCKR